MRWTTADDLTNAIEELDTTVHAGAPIAFSVRHCFAMVSDVVDLVWPEIERLRVENDLLKLPNGHWHVGVTDGDITVTQLAEVQIGTRRLDPPMWIDIPEQENDR